MKRKLEPIGHCESCAQHIETVILVIRVFLDVIF